MVQDSTTTGGGGPVASAPRGWNSRKRKPVNGGHSYPVGKEWTERAIVDLGGGVFAPGQLYVALSRLRTLEGLTLTRPIREEECRAHPAVCEFMKRGGATPSARRSA